ncbi:MAG: cysteine desulfurase NifS [Chloroflexi bacterium HGW-Chloroflexi-4]|nr:MAG: cysteine desulfurase NifS [Chloroflexi bacterium HGW-Chloroflexi-4]
MDRIYLDYAATTPVAQSVIEAMLPYFGTEFGNPSSAHYYGQLAEGAIEQSRRDIKKVFNADDYDVIFTSGGSESDNLALRGAALEQRKRNGATKILISSVEHDAVGHTAAQLQQKSGFISVKLRVAKNGIVDLSQLKEQLNKQVVLVSIIYGNNEVGSINPIKEAAKLCHEHGILFHTDAVQAAAHLKIDLSDLDVDYLSISAHKFYGPKGVGALFKKKFLPLLPQITGGGQESGFRAGTSNVPLIVGMVKALEINNESINAENSRLIALRDKLITNVLRTIPESQLTGHIKDRLSNHASFVFDGLSGNDLLIALDMAGYAVSSGSACKVGNPKPSEVLLALGIKPSLALGSLRVTLGKSTSENDLDKLLTDLPEVVKNLRKEKQLKNGN